MSRSSAKFKVKYQGHISKKKMAVSGALVFYKHILLSSADAFTLDQAKILSHVKRVNPFSDDKILDWSKLKQIADDILKCI